MNGFNIADYCQRVANTQVQKSLKKEAEDEMVGGHHHLNGDEFEQTLEIMKGREAWSAIVCGVTKRSDTA